MQQPEDGLSLEDLTQILCAAAIRSGDMLELDRLAEMPATQRVVHATQILSKSASADPWIAKVLSDTQAAPAMRAEFMKRRTQQ